LVLLSSGECHSLAVCEALLAGLGVVVSEPASANLESKPWITVIPNEKLDDLVFVSNAIESNREIAMQNRREIREYGLANFTTDVSLTKL
jgi:hypothetical protein